MSAPQGYPAHWEFDAVLSDGGTVHIRPIVPDDAALLTEFHSRLSEQTIYYRFFGSYATIPQRDLTRFTSVDYSDRNALVAVLGGQIIGVTRYDRLEDPLEAEVAFVVEDAHQGRGLGSVLLEHLAATAWERGVRRFVAEVLPINRRMIRVFHDAGFSTTSEYDQDVVHLSFPIEPTAASLSVLRSREHQAEARSVARLLRPASVAVVGASRDEHSVGRALLRHLAGGGFTGTIAAVNPVAHLDAQGPTGVTTYASVLDVPDELDLAVVAVPAGVVQQVVQQCATKGVRALVVVSAGFAEAGPEGAAAERALVELAHANGMRVVGPNCLGVINTAPDVAMNASLAPELPPRGQVGLFAQSGALGIGVLQSFVRRGLGLSSFVSAGNRADVSGNDLLQYWEDDESTELVLMYLESMGNPRKFARISRRIARRKPIVVVKSRRSWRERDAAAGDPPELADDTVDALFRQAGVIRVATVDELLDIAQVLAYQPLAAGRRVGIVGNSTALVVLAADACVAAGLTVAGRPADVGAMSGPAEFAAALSLVLADPAVDAVVTVFVPPLTTPAMEVARVLTEVAADVDKPIVSVFLGFDGMPPALQRPSPPGTAPGRGSIPSFGSPEPAVYALARAISYAEWRSRPEGVLTDLAGVDSEAARSLVQGWLDGHHPSGGWLPDDRAAELLALYGVPVWPTTRVGSAEEAVAAADRLGYPVALKATEASLRHRADLGGVRLDLATEADVHAAYRLLAARHGAAAVTAVVQSMAPPGIATVVATVESRSFGPVLSFGLGGVATDLLGDRAHRILPLTDRDAAELVRSVRAAPLLFGYRGTQPVDTAGLEQLLLRVGRLADELPEVAELALNPVVVAADGCFVLAAEVRLSQPEARTDVGPRRLH
ncbi:MAG: GNAT family N-acetyltransferase [Actinomycetota bacterium]|nr:GNAT family N-acetyltransferase [Actinomycetota bacterium]